MTKTAPSATPRNQVLIVEDEWTVCELLSDYVSAAGLQPCCVTSDRQAHDALQRREPFACLIVDVNLGAGTTGYDVARFARKCDSTLPILYVSGQTSEASYLANGVPGSLFAAKPFTATDIAERLRMLIGDNDQ